MTDGDMTEAAKDECVGLEISVTAGPPLVPEHAKLAAVVYNMPQDRQRWRSTTRSTAGDDVSGTRAIELARMHFNTDIDWYLDNSFCGNFHQQAQQIKSFETLATAMVALTFGSSILAMLGFLVFLIRKVDLPANPNPNPNPTLTTLTPLLALTPTLTLAPALALALTPTRCRRTAAWACGRRWRR